MCDETRDAQKSGVDAGSDKCKNDIRLKSNGS